MATRHYFAVPAACSTCHDSKAQEMVNLKIDILEFCPVSYHQPLNIVKKIAFIFIQRWLEELKAWIPLLLSAYTRYILKGSS